jgi:hypothetical protein
MVQSESSMSLLISIIDASLSQLYLVELWQPVSHLLYLNDLLSRAQRLVPLEEIRICKSTL